MPAVPSSVTEAVGDRSELAYLFGAKLERLRGGYEVVERSEQVAGRVAALIRSWDPETRAVLSWAPNQIPVPQLEQRLEAAGIRLLVPHDLYDLETRDRAAALSVGLTCVDAAFASTGSVVVAPGPGKSRAAALLPLHHLLIIPMSRLYPTIEAWLEALRNEGNLGTFVRESDQIAFITGPSKSADIELTLTLGVHGPKVVHAILYNDDS
jgi:L-lactate dehydrogenase complex protein LldG